MVMTRFGTTHCGHTLPADSPKALGLVDIALHPHLDYELFPENSAANLEKLAATIPFPSYAIDDQTAIKVTDSTVEVISQGHWKLFDA
jgi:dipeptidase E